MHRLIALWVASTFLATNVVAAPATVTAGVNLRSGPGTSFKAIGSMPKGSTVDLKDCDRGGKWCAVSTKDRTGFIAGQYLAQTSDQAPPWPRTFTTDTGAALKLFAPQVVNWSSFTKLDALMAAELKVSKDASPVYGVIGVSARTIPEDEKGTVLLTDVQPTSVNFSTLDKEQLSKLALGVGRILPTDPISVSQERLAASLASHQRMNDVSGLKAETPPIFHSEKPAILVQTDGKAVLSPVQGVQSLSFVVNTNWDIFQTDTDKTFYLRDEKGWLKSSSLESGWVETDALPTEISNLPDDESWKDVRASLPAKKFAGVPTVFYSEKPAELIVFEGRPAPTRSRHPRLSTTSPMSGFTRPSPTPSGTATRPATSAPISPGTLSSGGRAGPTIPTGTSAGMAATGLTIPDP